MLCAQATNCCPPALQRIRSLILTNPNPRSISGPSKVSVCRILQINSFKEEFHSTEGTRIHRESVNSITATTFPTSINSHSSQPTPARSETLSSITLLDSKTQNSQTSKVLNKMKRKGILRKEAISLIKRK